MAVDDHSLMMAAIVGECNGSTVQTDMHVVAEASDGDEAGNAFSQTLSRSYINGYYHVQGERHERHRGHRLDSPAIPTGENRCAGLLLRVTFM